MVIHDIKDTMVKYNVIHALGGLCTNNISKMYPCTVQEEGEHTQMTHPTLKWHCHPMNFHSFHCGLDFRTRVLLLNSGKYWFVRFLGSAPWRAASVLMPYGEREREHCVIGWPVDTQPECEHLNIICIIGRDSVPAQKYIYIYILPAFLSLLL